MKHLKSILFATTLFFATTFTTQAQSKVAHINTQELVMAMPEMQAASSELEKLSKTYQDEIKSQVSAMESVREQYAAEAETKTDEENGKRIQELQEFEQNIREFQAQAQQEMQKKQQELTSPVFEKAKNAILTVGKAKGYDYVLDSSEGQGVLFAGGTDLMQDVKVELGF